MFSVIVPAWNARATLRRTVQTVLDQDYADFELIVVDDGSTDDGISTIRDLDDGRLRIVRREQGGAAAARNTGLEAAAGDWFAFLDADDLWFPDHLTELNRVRLAHPRAGLIGTNFLKTSSPENFLDAYRGESRISEISYFGIRGSWKRPFNMSTLAISRDAYARLGGFGPYRLGQDSELQLRYALSCPVAASTRKTAIYVSSTGGISDSFVRRWTNAPLSSVTELSPAVALIVSRRHELDEAQQPRIDRYIEHYVSSCLHTSASLGDVKTIRKLWRLYPGFPPLADLPYLALGLLPCTGSGFIFAALKYVRKRLRS